MRSLFVFYGLMSCSLFYDMFEFVLQNMVSSFRVSELQVLLGFAGRNKSGRKHELLLRALHLLRSGCSPAVQIKIKELYRRRYPRTFDGLEDLAALKSSIKSFFQVDDGATVVGSDLVPQTAHSDLVQQHPVSCDSSVFHESKPMMNMQQPTPLMAPVHPDVQMKSLPFYDVLDVLIKPSSLGNLIKLLVFPALHCVHYCAMHLTYFSGIFTAIEREFGYD